MRLYSGKITPLSDELVKALAENKEIECESRREVARDLEAVFSNYLAIERDVNDKAKEVVQSRGLPPSEISRIKKLTAEQKGIKIGDELMDHLLDQVIEMLMHSHNVEEVFAEDHEIRRRIRPILKKYLDVDTEVEAEVRGQLKHVQEGTRTWEIEYKRLMGDIQRRKGLV